MIPLPGSKKAKRRVRKYSSKEFEFAERLYRVWMTMSKRVHRKNTWEHVYNVVMMLNVQACRLYRSIVNECGAAEGFSANILSRSLFETVLASAFILNKHVRIQVLPALDGNNVHSPDKNGVLPYRISTNKPKPRVNRTGGTQYKPKRRRLNYPPTELRARLYFAHGIFSDHRRFTSMAKLKGIKRSMGKMLKKIDPREIAEAEKMIGPGWSYILRDSDSYSGLGIDRLAQLLGPSLDRWYKTIYGIQCKLVHATDATRHVTVINGQVRPRFFSAAPEVDSVLHGASALLLMLIKACDDTFEFHPIDSMKIKGLYDEFKTYK